jgi:hypothetical protein
VYGHRANHHRVSPIAPHTAMKQLRIVTSGISGGGSLTRPFRDARRFPLTRFSPYSHAHVGRERFGICPSFQGPFSVAPCQTFSGLTNRCVDGLADTAWTMRTASAHGWRMQTSVRAAAPSKPPAPSTPTPSPSSQVSAQCLLFHCVAPTSATRFTSSSRRVEF